jgi:pyruvate/2-oxoglutarate/acetoin dehydrogenase E1 component
MYLDFVGMCFDQIMNQAAKLRSMTGGRAPMWNLVIVSVPAAASGLNAAERFPEHRERLPGDTQLAARGRSTRPEEIVRSS